jgi:glycosyltransferase involved in cell wall biosynthesis
MSTETIDQLEQLTAATTSRRALRIAICGIRGIPHSYGGAEAVLNELGPRLAARGHEVTVYCRRGQFRERPKSYRGVRLIYLPNIETKVFGTPTHTLLSMTDVLFRHTDVIIAWNLTNAFHCMIPRLFGKSVAIMVDGLDWKRTKWGRLGRAYLHQSARWVGRICPKGVITDTLDMQRVYREEFGTSSAYIPCAANVEISTDPDVVRRFGLEPYQYYLVASRLVPENNADLIARAFERVRSGRLLAIAGDANYRSSFVKQLRQTGDSRVRFLGHVANLAEVKELHCNAYAYIHGHSAGGTNPALLKALGCGNCILALDTPSNMEVLGDYGMSFARDAGALAGKIQYMDDRPEVAEAYRMRAPERIRKKYDWRKITDQYEEFFVRLASGENPTTDGLRRECAQSGAQQG